MRPCPSCGSFSRIELAPSLFECIADKNSEPGDHASSENGDACAVHYLDTSDKRQGSAMTALGRILERLLNGE